MLSSTQKERERESERKEKERKKILGLKSRDVWPTLMPGKYLCGTRLFLVRASDTTIVRYKEMTNHKELKKCLKSLDLWPTLMSGK